MFSRILSMAWEPKEMNKTKKEKTIEKSKFNIIEE